MREDIFKGKEEVNMIKKKVLLLMMLMIILLVGCGTSATDSSASKESSSSVSASKNWFTTEEIEKLPTIMWSNYVSTEEYNEQEPLFLQVDSVTDSGSVLVRYGMDVQYAKSMGYTYEYLEGDRNNAFVLLNCNATLTEKEVSLHADNAPFSFECNWKRSEEGEIRYAVNGVDGTLARVEETSENPITDFFDKLYTLGEQRKASGDKNVEWVCVGETSYAGTNSLPMERICYEYNNKNQLTKS